MYHVLHILQLLLSQLHVSSVKKVMLSQIYQCYRSSFSSCLIHTYYGINSTSPDIYVCIANWWHLLALVYYVRGPDLLCHKTHLCSSSPASLPSRLWTALSSLMKRSLKTSHFLAHLQHLVELLESTYTNPVHRYVLGSAHSTLTLVWHNVCRCLLIRLLTHIYTHKTHTFAQCTRCVYTYTYVFIYILMDSFKLMELCICPHTYMLCPISLPVHPSDL